LNYVVVFLPVVTRRPISWSLSPVPISVILFGFNQKEIVSSSVRLTLYGPLRVKPSDRFHSGGINGRHPFRIGYRVDFNLLRFAQKALCSKQNAESVRIYVVVQIFAGFPRLYQTENVPVFDIPQNLTAQTTPFIFRWLNHRKKCLHNLCPLLSMYSWLF
jgi:hypothetical protein